ncbi:hypothetical protein SAMN05216436_10526 [bacterium A37T11]|nr:hypothetical protein SAMN05216436_10526 [bacterium A37T11]
MFKRKNYKSLRSLLLLWPLWSVAQTPAKVGSLITSDRHYAKLAAVDGPYKVFLEASNDSTIFFKPGPVSALQFLKNRPNIPDVMSWTPTFAVVAKSMEWGVTSGSVSFQRVGARKRYGQYLTVWERDKNSIWKMLLRAEMEHHEPKNKLAPVWDEPADDRYVKLRSQARLQQRNELVFSTDQLMGTILKADNPTAYKEFLTDDARFLFPWEEPVQGKPAIQAFLKKRKLDIKTTPIKVDRPYSGELAYSYGDAKIIIDNLVKPYYYIRIWKVQTDFQWKVILEMYMEK